MGHFLDRTIARRDGSLRDDVTPDDVIVFGAMLAQPLPATTGWDVIAHRLKGIYLDGLRG